MFRKYKRFIKFNFLSNLNVDGDANISGISVFNMNTNINSLSSQSYLDITNIKAISTTICNNLNSLSSPSYFLTNYTNLNNLNVS